MSPVVSRMGYVREISAPCRGNVAGVEPELNLALCLPFRYLIKFLSKLSEYQDINKMTPSNIAIVLGPNLLWPQAEG